MNIMMRSGSDKSEKSSKRLRLRLRLRDVFKDKSGVDDIIVKKQPYQLLGINCEFLPFFLMPPIIYKLVNESS